MSGAPGSNTFGCFSLELYQGQEIMLGTTLHRRKIVFTKLSHHRHDTDSSIPRTPMEIRDMNRETARKMDRIFTPRGVTVVPSIGVSNWPMRQYNDLPFVE